jgi:hypothetical protein
MPDGIEHPLTALPLAGPFVFGELRAPNLSARNQPARILTIRVILSGSGQSGRRTGHGSHRAEPELEQHRQAGDAPPQ